MPLTVAAVRFPHLIAAAGSEDWEDKPEKILL